MSTVREVVKRFKEKLSVLYEPDEADQIILYAFEHCFAFTRAELILRETETVRGHEAGELEDILSGLIDGKPIQYILGYSWFMDKKFKVSPDVLIPRQETEELLRWIIQDNSTHKSNNLNVLDICTGSGCIAICLGLNFPDWSIDALDISNAALRIAAENKETFQTNVHLIQSDFLNWELDKNLLHFLKSPIEANIGLDIIVSNPPYVKESERVIMHPRVLKHEPSLALFVPDEDPLIFYKKIAEFAKVTLNPGGKIYLEINRAHAREIVKLFDPTDFTDILIRKDIQDNDRMISVTFNAYAKSK